jgi:HK97 family phage prohead protease
VSTTEAPLAPILGDRIRVVNPSWELLRFDEPETGAPLISGYMLRWDEWAEINNMLEGHFFERFQKGAFSKTIRESLKRGQVLFQHGQDGRVGQKPIARLLDIQEDETGPRYEAELLDAGYVRDEVLPGLRAGLYGTSFTWRPVKQQDEQRPRRSSRNPEGLRETTVTEAFLRELGPVTFPAYAGSSATVRSLTDEFALGALTRSQQPFWTLGETVRSEPESDPPADEPEPEPTEPAEPVTPSEPEPSEATTQPPKRTGTVRDYLNTRTEAPWQL